MNNTLMPVRRLWLFGCFSILLGGMASLKLFSLHSSFMDLGVFEWNFWAIVFDGQWQRAFWGHSQPLMPVLGVGYRIFHSAYFLVVLQAVVLATPLLLIPKFAGYFNGVTGELLRKGTCVYLPVAAYILFFPVWFNALFDFHMDHLAVPLGFLFYLACFKKRWGWAVVAGMFLALVKEPFALATAACGFYIICKQLAGGADKNKSKRIIPYIAGSFLVIYGLGYFYIAVNVIMPYLTGGQQGAGFRGSAYSWMGTNITDIAIYLLTHPFVTLKEIISPLRKVVYVIALLGTLSFIPVLSPLELIPAVPILAISLLSRLDNFYGLGHHYTAGLIAPLLVAFIAGLPKALRLIEKLGLSRRVACFLLMGVLLASNILISPSPISRFFWTNKIWKYGYSAYLPTARSRMINVAVRKNIPVDPNVAVSTQNNINLSYLAQREVCLPFPEAVLAAHPLPDWGYPGRTRTVSADYVVLDLKRPLFLVDKGCDWQYGKCRDEAFVTKFMATLSDTRKLFAPVYEQDGFMILKRK